MDIVVDPIGGPTFDDAIRVLAIDGKLLVIGFAAGGIPTVKVNRLLLRNVSVMGVAWGEYLNKVPGSAALFSWGLSQLVFLGLKPPPPQRYPLSEASGGVAVPGRRRRARQARARAVDRFFAPVTVVTGGTVCATCPPISDNSEFFGHQLISWSPKLALRNRECRKTNRRGYQ